MSPHRPVVASLSAWAVFLLLALPARAQEEAAEPEPRRGLLIHTADAVQGHTLIAPIMSKTAYLVDMAGEPVHTWELPYPPSAVYLLENGNLLYCGRLEDNPRFSGGGICGAVIELDWEGNVVWEYVLADDYQTQHHDIEVLPNGNVLMIVWEHRFAEDVLEWGRDPAETGEAGLWPDAVLEVEPTRPEGGEIVWEWHAWDHTVQDFDPARSNYGSVPDHPELIDINSDHRDQPAMTEAERKRLEELEEQMRALGYSGGDEDEEDRGGAPPGSDKRPDWLHTNGIAYQPEYDLIVLSIPELNELWVLDHSTSIDDAAGRSGGRWGQGGALLYRWGNPRNYGMGTDADRRLFYQHDPTWITGPEGDLRLLVYNNGGGVPTATTRRCSSSSSPLIRRRASSARRDAPSVPPSPSGSTRTGGTSTRGSSRVRSAFPGATP